MYLLVSLTTLHTFILMTPQLSMSYRVLTHWGRVTHICVGNLAIIGSDNGLSPGRRQAIIWINAGILLIGPLGTNFSEILIGIQTFSFRKIHLNVSSAKWRPFCLGLNVLRSGKIVFWTLELTVTPNTSANQAWECAAKQRAFIAIVEDNRWLSRPFSVD